MGALQGNGDTFCVQEVQIIHHSPRMSELNFDHDSRFVHGVERWMMSQVEQSKNRVSDDIPSILDFILMRRETFGCAMAEGRICVCDQTIQRAENCISADGIFSQHRYS